ncbi:hypothetical protein BI347_00055 [Chromobacterium sphagni]|uniref:Flagellar motor switch protein FliN-like C-terminal domain-containing protein n=1 Tax=Chromobacterium sphagni TaxID=1903179 RepID=A0A1S1WY58_9NEIS|nr:FliM/FliN family flagellar motor C-terminal domain-containing protein [Chromobacterium sphagni]OHX12060.1 hypothetical protein BI347_00055 [Chromobacterium sphagni]
MDALPFRLYGHRELARVEEQVLAATSRWLESWSGADGTLQVSATPAQLADVVSSAWLTAGEGQPALRADSGLYGFFSQLCFGAEKSRAALAASELAQPVLQAAMESWAAALTQAEQASAYSTEQAGEALAAIYTATGALWLEVRSGSQRLSALVSAACAAKMLPRPAPGPELAPLSLRELRLEGEVALEVYAAATGFTVQEAGTIRPGDVIRLDQRIGDAFELRLKDGSVVGRVEYGVSRARLAVRVAR